MNGQQCFIHSKQWLRNKPNYFQLQDTTCINSAHTGPEYIGTLLFYTVQLDYTPQKKHYEESTGDTSAVSMGSSGVCQILMKFVLHH